MVFTPSATCHVEESLDVASPTGLKAQYVLGMPEMIFAGLSERWLVKESGNVHWKLICQDLQTQSAELMDASNERLYASFLRVRMESTCHLQCYRESEALTLTATLSRFGAQRFYSLLSYSAGNKTIRCGMNTVFVSREADNKSLAKSKPLSLEVSSCHVHPVVPVFGQVYHSMKEIAFANRSAALDTVLQLAHHDFFWSNEEIFTTEYRINPYHDFNGVNLLYFASYSRINDICERLYMEAQACSKGNTDEWAMAAAPVARDIFYYGNADLGDTLVFRLHSVALVTNHIVKLHSSISRKLDGARIADVFTVKQLVDLSSGYGSLWRQMA